MKLKEIMDTGKLNFTGMKTLFEGITNGTLKLTEEQDLLVDVSTNGQKFKDIATAIDGNLNDVIQLLNWGDVKNTKAEKAGNKKVLVIIQDEEETFIHEVDSILFGMAKGEQAITGIVGRTNTMEMIAMHKAMKAPITESAIKGNPLGELLGIITGDTGSLGDLINKVCNCDECDKMDCPGRELRKVRN